MLTITENALKKVREYLAADAELAGKSLRIAVQGGGCSGFQYDISFDDVQEGDEVIKAAADVQVVVDPTSLTYLQESQVDYVETLTAAGFSITNPQVKSACGCGQSFNV